MKLDRLMLPFLAWAALPGALAAQQPADAATRVDAVFARWNTRASPGCAVAVAQEGRSPFLRAYGMADLEHDVPVDAATVFEAGSVSKQFTAAAVVLLALDGKLALDDDVRKYIPEVPQYAWPITLRHMLTHTSGLRDWGSVAGISGWSRGISRVHARARPRDREPADGTQLPAWPRVLLQQHRLQPAGDPRGSGERHAVRRIHPETSLRAARHDRHSVA